MPQAPARLFRRFFNLPECGKLDAMKYRALLLVAMTAGLLLHADETPPTLELFAGWGWYPFLYDDGPARYRPCPYWYPMPMAGIAMPLYGQGGDPFLTPYGCYGYAPYWGFGYGTRLALKEPSLFPSLSQSLLSADLPGSAPLAPRQPQRERRWDEDIERFLSGLGSDPFSRSSTNMPPQTKSDVRSSGPEAAPPSP